MWGHRRHRRGAVRHRRHRGLPITAGEDLQAMINRRRRRRPTVAVADWRHGHRTKEGLEARYKTVRLGRTERGKLGGGCRHAVG